MTFMGDTRAEHSVLTTPVTPLTGRIATVVGATGDMAARSSCKARSCQLGGHLVTQEFLYLPECPIPLLGRDLRTKLGAQITFAPGKSASIYVREPIGSDDGCDHAQGVLMVSLFLREETNKPPSQNAKRIP